VSVRNVLLLVGCLAVLGAAGVLADVAMRSATVAPTQVAKAPVVVDQNTDNGSAQLTVLAPVTFDSGGGQRVVEAGTQFVTTSALLAGSLSPQATPAAGTTLSCDLRVSIYQARPVIDLVRCQPARTTARG
jgi:hypothetical protein